MTEPMFSGLDLELWRAAWDYTAADAADAIGIGRSTYFRYIKYDKLPKSVYLAVIGHNTQKQWPKCKDCKAPTEELRDGRCDDCIVAAYKGVYTL